MTKLMGLITFLIIFIHSESYGSINLEENQKPNIVWITIEDTSPQFLGCYGNDDANTPNIDKLAREGVKFTNAFSTGSVCSPSRTAIITGVKTYKTGTGHHRSKFSIPDFIVGFPLFMKQLGYYTTNNSKTDYNIGNEREFINLTWDESSNNAGWWNRRKGQPFFSVFNFMDSHQSRTMTETYSWYSENVLSNLSDEEKIADSEFDMPPFYYDSPDMRRQFARIYNSLRLTDNKIGELLDQLEKDNLIDSTIIIFYSDHGEGMPRGKTNGIDYGYRVPFIIWFPEMYSNLSPWGTGGIVTEELIDFTDLAPTMISIAGGNAPEYVDGRSFLGKNRVEGDEYLILSSDRSDNGVDITRSVTDGRYMYSRVFMSFMNEARIIRYMEIGEIKNIMWHDYNMGNLNPLQSSLFEPRYAEYLYDTKHDQWETINLIEDRNHFDILIKMREILENEILSSKDIMFIPEYELNNISTFGNAYEYRLNNENYPIDKIYKAIKLSGFRGENILLEQVDLLKCENKFVRYWALIGLRSQPSEYLTSHLNSLRKYLEDENEPNVIVAAAILNEISQNKEAEKILRNFISSSDNNLALTAINFVLYSKKKELFIDSIIGKYGDSNSDYKVKAGCLDVLGVLGLIPNTPDFRD